MKTRELIISLLALCWISRLSPALAQTGPDDFYRPWVDYRNGAVSLAFDQTPIPFALSAIHATTGFQIVVPPASATKMVNLKLDHQPLEPAVRSLISSIGYKKFRLQRTTKKDIHTAPLCLARGRTLPMHEQRPLKSSQWYNRCLPMSGIKCKRLGALERTETGRTRPDRRSFEKLTGIRRARPIDKTVRHADLGYNQISCFGLRAIRFTALVGAIIKKVTRPTIPWSQCARLPPSPEILPNRLAGGPRANRCRSRCRQ